jgi:hypothetical protein
MIRDKVASIMFLYPFYIPVLSVFLKLRSLAQTRYLQHKQDTYSIQMRKLQHSNEKVTSASHSVMVSFLSSGNDTDQDDRAALKSDLSFTTSRDLWR